MELLRRLGLVEDIRKLGIKSDSFTYAVSSKADDV